MPAFTDFMLSWKERIAQSQKTEQQYAPPLLRCETANGSALLPSEPEDDLEYERRMRG